MISTDEGQIKAALFFMSFSQQTIPVSNIFMMYPHCVHFFKKKKNVSLIRGPTSVDKMAPADLVLSTFCPYWR